MAMLLELQTFDPGIPCSHPAAFADLVATRVESAWAEGVDLVLLPEFAWLGLEPLVDAAGFPCPFHAVASIFWNELHPALARRLSKPGKAVVLGTCPWFNPATGALHNRAPILVEGRELFQDKLHLTPWEKAFSPGDRVQLWQFGGLKMGVIICLDIEVPELAARLRDEGVDLILCPSATETILGVERVDRCASARAVELGCHVGVAHLTGSAKSDLIDENVGRVALYHPSQAVFQKAPRWVEGPVVAAGLQTLRHPVDAAALERMRRMTIETNPSLLGRESAGISRRIVVES